MSAMNVSNLTKEYLVKLFAENKRFDGRKNFDLKDFQVEYGVSNKAEGSARVKLGKTEVVVGIKLQTGEPYPDSPNAGNLMVSGDLLPLASPRFESGPPKFDAIEMPRLIDRMLRESGFIDLKKLVIEEGKNVWTVIVDIYPINDDGALIDAASIASVAALRNAKFPGLHENGKVDFDKKTEERLPLAEEVIPLSFTFFKLRDSIILHPTREEEEACEAKVTFGVSYWKGQYMVNSCQKGMKVPFTRDELETISKMLPEKHEEIVKTLRTKLDENQKA
ncbi:RNA-binding protein [Candidatus Pacearchaeota archaeon CG10_big_fil_rev_8_21_14_0_10_34_76]|nr:MAG: RNA-binding protein [Candidatus Pacearchaeota archaeon CG10_big_fil_rev_8_21_14_0_10_34_76]